MSLVAIGTAIARKNPWVEATELLHENPEIAPEFRTPKSRFKSGVLRTLYSCVPGTFGRSRTAFPLVTFRETAASCANAEPQIAASKAIVRQKRRAKNKIARST